MITRTHYEKDDVVLVRGTYHGNWLGKVLDSTMFLTTDPVLVYAVQDERDSTIREVLHQIIIGIPQDSDLLKQHLEESREVAIRIADQLIARDSIANLSRYNAYRDLITALELGLELISGD